MGDEYEELGPASGLPPPPLPPPPPQPLLPQSVPSPAFPALGATVPPPPPPASSPNGTPGNKEDRTVLQSISSKCTVFFDASSIYEYPTVWQRLDIVTSNFYPRTHPLRAV
uniref:WAS/WASL interacting protein family member 3 n=1 Tax=Ascaris lumbricoides TaxID=6252 RepID=A0A0M3HYV1_ASCLU